MDKNNYNQEQVLRLLTEEFGKKRIKNPSFSIRGFANQLGISAAALSQIMNGKRPVTNKSIAKIIEKLMLSPSQIKELRSNDNGLSTIINYKIPQQNFLSLDAYHLVADWQHYAILSLAETHDFKGEVEWIAKRLGLSHKKVKESIELLIKYGYLKEAKNGRVNLQTSNLRTTYDIPHSALKKRQHENLNNAQEALQNVDIKLREFCSTTMAIDSNKLPQAKQMIQEFMRKFSAFLEDGKQNEVYELAIQFFPRTKNYKENSNEI